ERGILFLGGNPCYPFEQVLRVTACLNGKESAMSRAISPSPQKRYFFRFIWLIPLLGVGALAFLAFAYYGVGFLLVRQVDSLYTARDCVNLVQQAEYIGRFYPSKIASFTDRSQEQAIECEAYLTADSLFEKQDWKAA